MDDSWRDRAVTWPIRRLALVIAVVAVVLGAPAFWLVDRHVPPSARVAEILLFAVFFSAWMSLIVFLARRRERAAVGELPPATRVEVNRALRVGDAPREPDLDQAAMALIEWRRGKLARSMRTGPWIWGLVLVLVALSMVIEPNVFHLVMIVYYAVLSIVVMVSARRQRTRLDRAERAVRLRSGA
ncbi:hypothetical protein [Actinoallomurus iriomotensis]|uniref:Transmembrane protein n=1 Tax=Actinoallomurus iriomotensis TaxID=478107 RepID=A0A9W6RG47_9ACTN|nr:hypothetical protein [Actinoallomurus iriomotensis]GLY73457.1 hypothetical protein Airi01_017240 [Actinoallomurus iriomotensis]